MILQMCVLLSVSGVLRSLTPPRIIYGGWTPILPGHPFYFGPVSRKTVESQYQQGDFEHPADDSYHKQPLHSVEHHFEQHLQFTAPQQLNQYADQQQFNQYADQQQPQQFNQYADQQQPQQFNQYADEEQRQQFNQYADEEQRQQFNQYADQQPQQFNQYTEQRQPQQFNQYKDQQQLQQFTEYADQQQPQQFNQYTNQQQVYPVTQDARHPVDGQHASYFSPDSQHRDKTALVDAPVQIQQVPPLVHKLNGDGYGPHLSEPATRGHSGRVQHGRSPQNNVHLHVPSQDGRFGGSNIPPQGHGQPYFSGQKSGKNIFSYYPPQSIYDEPKQPKIQLKPVYFESTGTRVNSHENPHHQHIPYPVPPPIKSLGPILLNSLDHGVDQKSFLKITPLGHVDPGALKQLGQITLRGIEYPAKNENYPLITDSSGGAPKYPRSNTDSPLVYSNNNSPLTKVSSGPNGGLAPYEFRHNSHLPSGYKSTNNIKLERPQTSKRPFNPIQTKSYSSELKAFKLIEKPRISVPYQKVKYTGPRILPYGPVRPYYPRKVLPVPYRLPGSQTLVHLPLRSAPGRYFPNSLPSYMKNVKFQTIYRSPSVVIKSVGPPALVDHLAVPPTPTGYPMSYVKEGDHVYYTAATTESSQVAHAQKLNSNVSDHERDRDRQLTTNLASDSDESISHDNSVDEGPYHHEYRYIFVSGDGTRTEKDGDVRTAVPEKQFFHAYYAPADHAAPPGYVKMTVQEFNNLFKNAEIRYVDKDPATVRRDVSTRNRAAS